MKHPRLTNFVASACLAAVAAVGAIAQNVEPSYELTLHLVVGSNEAGTRTELPASLDPIARHLKSNFAFAGYRLTNTFQSRLVDGGGTEYKSLMNISEAADPRQPAFLEFAITNFAALSQQKSLFQARTFRFGARVPVATGGSFKDDAGKSHPTTAYEHLGLTQTKLGIAENVPTLIGTLNLPGTNGTIFLVMTVKPV